MTLETKAQARKARKTIEVTQVVFVAGVSDVRRKGSASRQKAPIHVPGPAICRSRIVIITTYSSIAKLPRIRMAYDTAVISQLGQDRHAPAKKHGTNDSDKSK